MDGGPAGAAVTALLIDPDRPSIVYAGTVDGAVYRSTDAASSWRALDATGALGYVEDLALSGGRLLAAGPAGIFSLQVD